MSRLRGGGGQAKYSGIYLKISKINPKKPTYCQQNCGNRIRLIQDKNFNTNYFKRRPISTSFSVKRGPYNFSVSRAGYGRGRSGRSGYVRTRFPRLIKRDPGFQLASVNYKRLNPFYDTHDNSGILDFQNNLHSDDDADTLNQDLMKTLNKVLQMHKIKLHEKIPPESFQLRKKSKQYSRSLASQYTLRPADHEYNQFLDQFLDTTGHAIPGENVDFGGWKLVFV